MSGFVQILASVEGRREKRVLLKADGRTDAVWIERDALDLVSQNKADRADFGEEIEINMHREAAQEARFL